MIDIKKTTKRYKIQQLTCPLKQAEIVRNTMHQLSLEANNFVNTRCNEEICYFVKNEKAQIIGVIVGYLLYGSVFIDMLWVQKEYRKKGIGTKLVLKLENYAALQNATFCLVSTMEWWEAISFYESLGYKTEFIRCGYINNTKQYSLRKELK